MSRLIIAFLLSFVCMTAGSTPPGDLILSYDLINMGLTAQGPHPTQDLTEHFIRRMEVVINGQEKRVFYFPRQSSASEFKETVPVELKPGDNIHVAVFCSQGGSKEADLKIAEAQPIQIVPIDLKTIRDKDHETMPMIP